DELLNINTRVAKRFFSLSSSRVIAFDQRNVVMGNPHSAPAAPRHGFDHHRITDALGDPQGILLVINDAFGTRRSRNTRFLGQGAADGLVFQRIHGPRIWADKPNVAAFAHICEVRIFRQETIPRVNRIDIGDFGGADNAIDAEIALIGGGFADANGFVGQLDVHRVGVGLRIDRHGADVKFFARPNDADGNFSAIRYQNLL